MSLSVVNRPMRVRIFANIKLCVNPAAEPASRGLARPDFMP
jgi:hypothetical protein